MRMYCSFPEGMIKLNGSAGEILEALRRCNDAGRHHGGSRERSSAAANLSDDVIRFVRMAVEKNMAAKLLRNAAPGPRRRSRGRRCGCCWS